MIEGGGCERGGGGKRDEARREKGSTASVMAGCERGVFEGGGCERGVDVRGFCI